jgi:hypothetical protein
LLPKLCSSLILAVSLAPANAAVARAAQADEATRHGDSFTAEEKSFWSFQPVVDPRVPGVKDTGWPRSPLDHFILAGLESKRLRPAPAADKRTLIRRATFDLIGLPPTPQEINSFLADDSPDAFSRVVDRLLASPHYGERWARHWLDVARYADSNGMDENLAYGNAWRYRDYVVAAFNADKPYDQFVREQIAGDLIERGSRESAVGSRAENRRIASANTANSLLPTASPVVATGFLSLGAKMLAEDDPVKMEMDIIDEQVDTIGRTFLGLTLGCARCHDHKYDPIRMDDYYSLAGIFKSTKTMENFKVVARWHERPIGSAEEIERQRAHQQQVAAKKGEVDAIVKEANDALLREARRHVADYLLAATELERQNALVADLKSQLTNLKSDTSDAVLLPPGTILIEAENYARGNVKKEFTGYGEKIGVIYNQGELPNVAEYDVELAEAGAYQLELRFAAAESRPVKLFINGKLVKAGAATKTTGSWFPDTQVWSPEGIFALAAGKNTIRLERDQPFPHFDKVALVRQQSAVGAITAAPKTPEQLAAEHGLNIEILQQWVRYLSQTRSDSDSVLSAWHALVALRPAVADGVLFGDLKTAALRGLAARYQELSDEADRAWRELKDSKDGKDVKELPDRAEESLRILLYDPKGPFALPPKPDLYYAAETTAELTRQRAEIASLEKSFTPLPDAMGVTDGKVENLRVHLRGNHLTLGNEMSRRFPRIIAGESQSPLDDQQSGRLHLAEWLTQPENPLPARVMVNRIWRWHFGEALVRSTDNFGRLGDRPANPQLLDWLAARFVENGWSMKSLHRLIMLSATYQMSTAYNESAAAIDPENRLHWRMNRRRLEAEAIRDAILAASGQLDPTLGGSLLDTANRAYVKGYPNSVYDKYDFNRRSIYLPVLRSMLYDVFQAFDFADPSTPNGERATTTVAPQALFMMNSMLVGDQTRHLATSLLADGSLDDSARISAAYERTVGRSATAQETTRAFDFLRRYEAALELQKINSDERRIRSWQAFCRTILASNEFIFVE